MTTTYHKVHCNFTFIPLYFVLLFVLMFSFGQGQLDYRFYDQSCPRLPMIVRFNVWQAIRNDTRMAASLLRLYFHDCIVDGLDLKDVVVLSGAHTIGFAQCSTFKKRLFDFKDSGSSDPSMDSLMLSNLQNMCPNKDTSNSNLAPLDYSSTFRFDNSYYVNVVNKRGLLQSDQALLDDPIAAALVNSYSNDPYLFSNDFAASMIKLSTVGILTAPYGEIRKKCGSINNI
ncbi:hypothetical protein F8388_013925 [Cannabis sativa]|uniref:peroxidase n=1 Tax=Cannabis sativa TaxID=3483 RepID=A0A7J6FAR3_CANSA|nr:hypothetical protein F8388_013925 [Cannabis sativa]